MACAIGAIHEWNRQRPGTETVGLRPQLPLLRLRSIVNSDAARLDDPELADGRLAFDRDCDLLHKALKGSKSGARVSQDDDARVVLGRVGKDLSEVGVESQKASPFPLADCRDLLVRLSLHPLSADRGDVVAGSVEDLCEVRREVFVQLEAQLQEATSVDSDRSRVISAA